MHISKWMDRRAADTPHELRRLRAVCLLCQDFCHLFADLYEHVGRACEWKQEDLSNTPWFRRVLANMHCPYVAASLTSGKRETNRESFRLKLRLSPASCRFCGMQKFMVRGRQVLSSGRASFYEAAHLSKQ